MRLYAVATPQPPTFATVQLPVFGAPHDDAQDAWGSDTTVHSSATLQVAGFVRGRASCATAHCVPLDMFVPRQTTTDE